MPTSSLTKQSVRLLTFSYASTFCILLLLVLLGQTLIQLFLYQAYQGRTIATTIDMQITRTQNMFYNVLLLQSPGGGLDYLKITQEVEQDERPWEKAQDDLYHEQTGGIFPSFSPHSLVLIAQGKPIFVKMEQAYRQIFALEQKEHPASPDHVRPLVDIIYFQEKPFIDSILSLHADLIQESEGRTTIVRNVELFLSGFSILVLLLEAFFVIRPALLHLNRQLSLFALLQEKKDER